MAEVKTELQKMLDRAYTTGDHKRFCSLAGKMVRRLKKSRQEQQRSAGINVFRAIKTLRKMRGV